MSPTTPSYATLVQEAQAFALPPVVKRREIMGPLPAPAVFNLVHIITGIRRCGKTFYLFQLMGELLRDGVPRERMFTSTSPTTASNRHRRPC